MASVSCVVCSFQYLKMEKYDRYTCPIKTVFKRFTFSNVQCWRTLCPKMMSLIICKLLLNFYYSYALGNTHQLQREDGIHIEQTCSESIK